MGGGNSVVRAGPFYYYELVKASSQARTFPLPGCGCRLQASIPVDGKNGENPAARWRQLEHQMDCKCNFTLTTAFRRLPARAVHGATDGKPRPRNFREEMGSSNSCKPHTSHATVHGTKNGHRWELFAYCYRRSLAKLLFTDRPKTRKRLF